MAQARVQCMLRIPGRCSYTNDFGSVQIDMYTPGVTGYWALIGLDASS